MTKPGDSPAIKKKIRREKNFLPSIFFNKLKNLVTGRYFPWFFLNQTVFLPGVKHDKHFMFDHVLYNTAGSLTRSNYFKDFEPILYFLDDKIKVNKILRMKLNLYTNQNKIIEHVSHTDIFYKDKPKKDVSVEILNFTTCNGGTIIEGEKYPSNENELLIFNNLNKHFGIVQTDTQTRVVLNIATI